MKVTILSIFILFLINGCSNKEFLFGKKAIQKNITKSQKIVMKTKKFAFSDTAFYKNTPRLIQIQAYSSGVAIANMKFYKINDSVCFGNKCTNKKYFTDNFLSKNYPSSLIITILSKKPIFDKQNLKKIKDGFLQHIKSDSYDITYMVTKNFVYFKDKKNKILIKLSDLK